MLAEYRKDKTMRTRYNIASDYKQQLFERILTEEVPKVVAEIKAYEQNREPLQMFRLEVTRYNSKGIQTEHSSCICDEDDLMSRVNEARWLKASVSVKDNRIVTIRRDFPSGSHVIGTYTPITE